MVDLQNRDVMIVFFFAVLPTRSFFARDRFPGALFREGLHRDGRRHGYSSQELGEDADWLGGVARHGGARSTMLLLTTTVVR